MNLQLEDSRTCAENKNKYHDHELFKMHPVADEISCTLKVHLLENQGPRILLPL